MTTPPKEEQTLGEILDSVYAAGVRVTELHLDGRSSGTITSDTLYEAKLALTRWGNEQRVDELESLIAKHTRTYKQTVTDSEGRVYVEDSHGYVSRYETQERITELKSNIGVSDE
jgi:hypothetical protein